MSQTLKDIKVECDQHISIMCGSTISINVSKNIMMHSKTNHIPIKCHFLREQVVEKIVKLEYIATKEKIVDIFTKPLLKDMFEYMRKKLQVRSISSQNYVI